MGKGLALPINTMVALAIAVVVLLAMVAFFMGIIGPSGEQQTADQRFKACCTGYVLAGCPNSDTNDYTTHQCATDDTGNPIYLDDLAAPLGVFRDEIPQACGCVTGSNSGSFNPLTSPEDEPESEPEAEPEPEPEP